MQRAFNKSHWKSMLPEVYTWATQVKIETLTKCPDQSEQGVHMLVPVMAQNGKDSSANNLQILPTCLSAQVRDGLTQRAKDLGWRSSAAFLHTDFDGRRYTLVNVSSQKVSDPQKARQVGLDAVRALKDFEISTLCLCASEPLPAIQMFEGLAAGLCNIDGFKGQKAKNKLPEKILLCGGSAPSEQTVRMTRELCRAQALTRFLQDAPANYLDPIKFADIAQDIAKEVGIKHRIYNKKEMEELGMGSFLSVSDGSIIEPRFIVLEIDGQDNSRCVALVGKGLTFDCGGISIKPAAAMDEMKYDMSGGAAVLGAAHYLGHVKPPVKVACLIGATENMTSGSATRPGDIVKAMNGKTIEVLNTDAEGRLVLADMLCYAEKELKAETIINIATLTGAVLFALGCVGSAVMSNDDDLAHRLLEVGRTHGEPLWQLPLWPELEKEVKSEIADLKNIAKPNVKAGSIIGGIFLQEFIAKSKWAHLDIAGTGWNCQAVGYPAGGGSAFGLKTLVGFCTSYE